MAPGGCDETRTPRTGWGEFERARLTTHDGFEQGRAGRPQSADRAGGGEAGIEQQKATSVALVEDCLARIAAREPDLHAWAYVDREHALAQARARDARAAQEPAARRAGRHQGHLRHPRHADRLRLADLCGSPADERLRSSSR